MNDIDEIIEAKYINDVLGYGVFAKKLISEGTVIGEYAGVIGRGFHYNEYSWRYPSKLS